MTLMAAKGTALAPVPAPLDVDAALGAPRATGAARSAGEPRACAAGAAAWADGAGDDNELIVPDSTGPGGLGSSLSPSGMQCPLMLCSYVLVEYK